MKVCMAEMQTSKGDGCNAVSAYVKLCRQNDVMLWEPKTCSKILFITERKNNDYRYLLNIKHIFLSLIVCHKDYLSIKKRMGSDIIKTCIYVLRTNEYLLANIMVKIIRF